MKENLQFCVCIYIYICIKYIYIKIAWDGTLQPESIDCEMSSLKMRLVYVLKPLHNELLWLFDKLPPALGVWWLFLNSYLFSMFIPDFFFFF